MAKGTSKQAEAVPAPEETPVSAEASTESTVQVSKDEALKQSYAEATKTLRSENLAHFNDLRKQVMKRLGFEWSPPPTAEEQAKATIEELIAANPGLAELYRKVEQAEDAPEEVPQEGSESA